MNTSHPHPPHRRRHPARLLGALSLAGVLAFAGAACTSSKSTGTSTKTTNQANKHAGTITFRSLDAGGPLTSGALKSGSIDIAELFTFTPDIAKNGWVTLEDDKHLQAADNFVPLIRSDKNTAEIGAVIDAVDAKLTQDGLFALVKKVAVDAANPGDVAEQWLKDNTLPGDLKATGTMTVGSANFAESELVGQIYAKALKAAGVDVTFKDSVGNRQVTMPLMDKGDLDLMPEFTYSLLAYLNDKATPSERPRRGHPPAQGGPAQEPERPQADGRVRRQRLRRHRRHGQEVQPQDAVRPRKGQRRPDAGRTTRVPEERPVHPRPREGLRPELQGQVTRPHDPRAYRVSVVPHGALHDTRYAGAGSGAGGQGGSRGPRPTAALHLP